MHLALSLPWWLAIVLACFVGAFVFLEYRRPLAPLPRRQRAALAALRTIALAALMLFVFRPIALLPPRGSRDAVVPVLIDASRSMSLKDAGGLPRLLRAVSLLKTDLLPALSTKFKTELFAVGDALAPTTLDSVRAESTQTDLGGALRAVRERYRGQHLAGVVLISDGAETKPRADDGGQREDGPPVFAVGVGEAAGLRDREVLGITAGEQRLDHATIDVDVSAISHGFGRSPFELRLLVNGRTVDARRVVPPADGSPVDELFTIAPDPLHATVYTAEIPADRLEMVPENNSRSVLVSPAGRKRRLLIVEGAPGFEHSFVKRAWALDSGLEVDSAVRKGKNAEGRDTFLVQAAASRAPALTTGFPARREDLYAYDALVAANIEADFFTRAQLAMIGEFVSERGGGLLVLGGRSFTSRGFVGTPVEAVLPVDLDQRRAGIARTSFGARDTPAYKLVMTPEGEAHPIMRIGQSVDETRKLWSAMPALAAAAPLGGPRPGATVLAVAAAPTGSSYPVVAVQRFGRGRSMVFAGEASWRWKMMAAATDRTYELFWRQAARWLAASSPDPVSATLPESAEPGDSVSIDIDARDPAFALVADAAVTGTLTDPDGAEAALAFRRATSTAGRFTSTIRPEKRGLYHMRAEARRGATSLGTVDRWMFVGASDREFADPRLNEALLRRLARASGGRYVRAADASRVPSWIEGAPPQAAEPERRDLWHEPWAFALVLFALCTEWTLRRWWGLR